MGYHNKQLKFNINSYDPMDTGAMAQIIKKTKGIPNDDYKDYPDEWEDMLEHCKDAVNSIPSMEKRERDAVLAAYDNYYAQKNKKKSSTRDTVVAKVKKSRGK